VYFKFCSTFDSTPRGNIGPVLDALVDALAARSVIVAASAPRNGRTVFRSRLFVWDELLDESPMTDHPLNPMTDSDLRALLRPQSTKRVGTLPWEQVAGGNPPLELPADATHLIADAITESDLRVLGEAALHHPLSAGSAGLAAGMAQVHAGAAAADSVTLPRGPVAILAGSASSATRRQV